MRDVTGVDEDDEKYDIDLDSGVLTYSTKAKVPDPAQDDPFLNDAAEIITNNAGVHDLSKRSIRRKVNKRYEGTGGARSKQVEPEYLNGYGAFDVIHPPYNQRALAALYEKSTPHKAAVDAKTSNIVGLGYDLVPSEMTKYRLGQMSDKKADKFNARLAKGKIELLEHINSLNSEDSMYELLEKVWKDYESTGNGYIEIGRTDNGNIGYIGHLHAPTMRVRRLRDGFVQIVSNKVTFFRNFGGDEPDPIGRDSSPNEVIHIKRYAPANTFYGVPDIVPASTAVAGNEFSANFNIDYFENKAIPRHVITLKGATINPRLSARILEFFETGLKGQNHRSLFIPLPGDTDKKKVEFKISPVEAGVQDSSFNAYRKANLGEILMAHRVPVNKVGLPEGVSLAVARDADKTFKEQVCGPEQKKLEHKLNRVIADIQGEDVFVFKLTELTLTDEDTRSKIDERRIKTGTETPNEQRARRGQPMHPDGDELLDLSAKAPGLAAEARAEGGRERDAERSSSSTDSAGEGRNPKGEGRTNGTG